MKGLGVLQWFVLAILSIGCTTDRFEKKTNESAALFSQVSNKLTGIEFKNSIKQDAKFNALIYPYAYNGAGVAIGDVDNDGLEDIYFVSNQHSNKLYLNKGQFKFVDVTDEANVSDIGGWSTGVSMVDINNDGWLDIYVCKSASVENEDARRNKLFVNQKDGTFKEEAQTWGLNDNGFGTQSYFFDFDKDGDLDMYLLNHRHDFANANSFEDRKKRKLFIETSDHLYENQGTSFRDVTIKAGIRNKEFGLSASVGDFNADGWPDIYVANDLITPDYLYINNQDGTFSNQINDRFLHTSYTSMGSDYADINNDLMPDLLVVDMSAEDHRRGKENMPSMNTSGFWRMVNGGYHFSYMSNMLSLNRGNGYYTDMAQVAGISKTDWSWAPLIADLDCDGFKDMIITNGLEHELGNQDYRRILNEKQAKNPQMSISQILNTMPSEKLMNYAYRNNGDLSFTKVSKEWGLDKKVNSNGVAYGDLDNDGDLDLVYNNLEDQAMVYQNHSTGNFLNIILVGKEKNVDAIGARVKVYTKEKQQIQEQNPSRGYLSSVSRKLNFGLGDEEIVDRVEVIWTDGKVLAMENVRANQTLTFNQEEFKFDGQIRNPKENYFIKVDSRNLGIDFKHEENEFNDFSLQVLLPQKQSQKGPAMAIADVNGDGLDDFYVGGALGQSAALFIQMDRGRFKKSNEILFKKESLYEDIDALFFDSDNDGDVDLYVGSGSYELKNNDHRLQDRLYINDGTGNFVASKNLPKNLGVTNSVAASDIDQDGDLDLLVGGHVSPGQYPLSSQSRILRNHKGQFSDVTEEIAPELSQIGLVNDLLFSDYDQDGDEDLIVVGEWFPITFFTNTGGVFSQESMEPLNETSGWWNTIKEVDLDNDGDLDYLVGNLGHNNKFHPTAKKPLHVYSTNLGDDGKYDMMLSKEYKGNLVPTRGKECSTEQNPFVSEKISSYKEFANSTLFEIYGEETLAEAYHKEVQTFKSVFLRNNQGSFVVEELPMAAQLGPTMAFVDIDINSDGHLDIVGIGAIHEAEVETVRYDGNTGYVLIGDSEGTLMPYFDNSFFTIKNSKNMGKIRISDMDHLMIVNNDDELELFRLKGDSENAIAAK